jgi:hypothetical protein
MKTLKRKDDDTTGINVVPKKKTKYLQRYKYWYHTTWLLSFPVQKRRTLCCVQHLYGCVHDSKNDELFTDICKTNSIKKLSKVKNTTASINNFVYVPSQVHRQGIHFENEKQGRMPFL